MTSIFNTYYSRNVDRLKASFETPSSGKSDASAAEDRTGTKAEFSQVLADVEHPHRGGSNPPEMQHPSNGPPVIRETSRAMLTNLPEHSVVEHAAVPPAGFPRPGFANGIPGPLPNAHPGAQASLESLIRNQPNVPAERPQRSRDQNFTPIDGDALVPVKLEPHRVNPLPAPPPAPKLSPPRLEVTAPPPPSSGLPPQAPRIAEVRRELPVPGVPEMTASKPPSAPTVASYRRFEVMQRGATQVAQRSGTTKGPAIATPQPAIKEIVTTAGRFYGIDPNLGLAVAQVESSFDTDAVSRDGHSSKGLFQLLDSTGRSMHRNSGIEEKYNPFDPAQNAYLGMAYLRHLHDIFSSETKLTSKMRTIPAGSAEHVEKLAVAAYNAGEGNVARAQARAQALGRDPADYDAIEPFLPASTQRYVQRVTSIRESLALASEGRSTAKV